MVRARCLPWVFHLLSLCSSKGLDARCLLPGLPLSRPSENAVYWFSMLFLSAFFRSFFVFRQRMNLVYLAVPWTLWRIRATAVGAPSSTHRTQNSRECSSIPPACMLLLLL